MIRSAYANIAMATMTGVVTNQSTQSYTTIGKPGYSISFPFAVSPESAAQAGQAMAANPQNAAAILGQLINNPANRHGPPGFSFPVTGPGNSLGPQHAAMKKSDSTAGNTQYGMAVGELLIAQPQAARQDILIGQELEAIRQANQNLEHRLAMDVQFLEATNDRINLCNDRTLPVLKAITGQDLGAEPDKWKGWWTDQLGYAYQSNLPVTKPTYSDFVTLRRRLYPFSLLRRRYLGAIGRRPATDRIDPGRRQGLIARHIDWRARVSVGGGHPSQSACRHIPNQDRWGIDRRDRHPPLLESGQGLDDGPRAQGRRSIEDGRRYDPDRIDRGRQDSTRLQPRRGRKPRLLRGGQGAFGPRLQLCAAGRRAV